MTAFTAAGGASTRAPRAAASGAPPTGAAAGPRSTAGCRGCRSARWPPIPATARCWSAPVRRTTPPRTSTASARSGYSGSGTWTRVGGHELDGGGFYRIGSINGYLYAATSHGLWRRAESAADSAAWQLVLRPDPNPNNSPYRTSFITDVIAVPAAAADPGRRRLGRLRRRTGVDPVQRLLRGHRRRGQLPPHHADRATSTRRRSGGRRSRRRRAGCTRSSRTPRPTRCAARVPSCRRAAARPGRGR